jgi:hypothetical protein
MRGMVGAVLGMAFAGGAACASETYDLIFRSGTLQELSEGDRLEYRSVAEPDRAVAGGLGEALVWLTLMPGNRAALERSAGGRESLLGQFDAEVGNPIAMYFLERTVRTVAEATGGSPFYIRNRIKESLLEAERIARAPTRWDGRAIEATEIVLAPFKDDEHRAELGAFADLEITVIVSDEAPGWYRSIRAETPKRGDGARAFSSGLELTGVTR